MEEEQSSSFNISNMTHERKYNDENEVIEKTNTLTDFPDQIFGINMNIKML